MSGTGDSQTGAETKHFLRNRAADGWVAFVKHYGRTIYRWCRRCWGLGEAEAEDMTQLVLGKLFLKMQQQGDGVPLWESAKGRFHAWLKTVTRNAWLDAREERQRALGPGGARVVELLENDAVCADFAEQLERQDVLQVAQQRAQRRVAQTEWEVFRLRKIEEMPARQVAERLRLTPETVDNYTSRVRKILKQEIETLERGGEDCPEKAP